MESGHHDQAPCDFIGTLLWKNSILGISVVAAKIARVKSCIDFDVSTLLWSNLIKLATITLSLFQVVDLACKTCRSP